MIYIYKIFSSLYTTLCLFYISTMVRWFWVLISSALSGAQKNIIRIIMHNHHIAHTESLLKYLGLLKAETCFLLKFLHKLPLLIHMQNLVIYMLPFIFI